MTGPTLWGTMKLLKRSLILSCGVSASALVLAINAGADSFTIVNGQTVTTTQTLDTTGNVGTVEEGGVIDVLTGNGIEGTANGVTVNNAGSVTSGDNNGIFVLGESTVTNSGTATGGSYGIAADGDNNKITNSGTATGGSYGILADGSGNTITNSGTATGYYWGIAALGDNNTITNSGTATGSDYGIAADGNGDTITNSGKIIGGEAGVYFYRTDNTLTLLAGSNVQGILDLGPKVPTLVPGYNTLVIGRRLSTALTYLGGEGVILDTSGMPFVSSGGVLAVVDPTLFSAEGDMLNDLTRSLADLVDARLGSARSGHGAANMAAAAPTGIVPTADVPDAEEPQMVIWAAGIGNYRSEGSNGMYDGFDSTLGGFAIGADGVLSSGTRLGGFAGASFASLNTDAGTQAIDADSYYAGLYAGFTMSEAFLNLALTGGYTSQSTSRDVLNNMVAGGVEQAKGDPNGIFISPSATIGTDIATGGMIFTPSLRARYAGLFMDSYDENGSTADLSIDSRSVNLFDLRGQVAFAIKPIVTKKR